MYRLFLYCIAIFVAFPAPGAFAQAQRVVIYTSVDQPVAAPILQEFEQQTGIDVILQTDAEANKTVGLVERLRAEKDNPQADVWWGNEVFHTINLAEEGVLAPYSSPAAEQIPTMFKDPQHHWASAGMRARVIAVTKHRRAGVFKGLPEPTLESLTDPSLKGKVAIARPTAGTTGSHVAALYVLWGPERARHFFRDLRTNEVKLLGGNSVVAEQVGHGVMWAGLTDNDDVAAARREEGQLEMVLPNQQTYGTLTIPTTVALVAGAKNPDPARQLIDYLLSPEVERRLIEMNFARYSVREGAGEQIKPMDVDYREVARIMPQAVREATAILEGRASE